MKWKFLSKFNFLQMNKSCVIYHGFGSEPNPFRNKMLNAAGYVVLCEHFDYQKEYELDRGKSLFEAELKKIRGVDLILGISFGGYLGYKLSKATGIDLLLINPALNRKKSKSPVEYDIPDYSMKSNIDIFFGEFDTAVPKENTIEYLKEVGEDYTSNILEGMEHRTPESYFIRILKESYLI